MVTSPSILIVDDNPTGRQILNGLLVDQNYSIDFATNGVEALQKISSSKPDLVLLDVMMPDMDGFEVCQHLKANNDWQHIPIILVTALDGKEDLAHGLNVGADDFISKPVNGLELRARIRSMLRIKQQYDALKRQKSELKTSLHLNQKFSHVFAQHLETLEIVHNTSIQLMNNLNMDSVLDLVSQAVLDLVPEAKGCVMHLLSDDDQQLLPVVYSSETTSKIVYPDLGIEEIIHQAIQEGHTLIVPDVDCNKCHKLNQIPEIRSLLVTPLFEGNKAVGTLSIYRSDPVPFEADYQYVLSIIGTQAAVAISRAKLLRAKELANEKEKWAIRNIFQRYVSPAVVDQVVEDRNNLALGGQRQEVTILFADIRGFTTFSEDRDPEQLIDVLNSYLALAVKAILAEEGTLDKFMGDAVMAIFNAPLAQSDHAIRAVRAALTMQQAIDQYNREHAVGQALSFGIGLHRGQAVVGNIGTAQQMNYTAIGDTINLAKRLQEYAAGGDILLSQAIYQPLQNQIEVEALGHLTVKGRRTPVNSYKLLGLATS
ncbi:MAG: response regulator [Anaerolineae bacterium]|nr:response regulator [Anaerolineae bacterium]